VLRQLGIWQALMLSPKGLAPRLDLRLLPACRFEAASSCIAELPSVNAGGVAVRGFDRWPCRSAASAADLRLSIREGQLADVAEEEGVPTFRLGDDLGLRCPPAPALAEEPLELVGAPSQLGDFRLGCIR